MDSVASVATDLSIEEWRRRIAQVGASDEDVYAYVVRSVRPANGEYVQTGSAPNFQGGLITLCTCKHGMRATLTPEQWERGVWVAGLTSWDQAFGKQQSLVYFMRVGEAYASQAELVQAFRQSGRSEVVDAKDSTRHRLGDLMIPASDMVAGNDRYLPAAYLSPMVGHSHRSTAEDAGWEDDVNYVGVGGGQSVMLVGDRNFSFVWTRPLVRRRRPGPTRPYRKWTLTSILDDLEAVQK
ncbi:hypothetical protein F6X37_30770 [Paraburkholderia sp. 31.1]|uniref:Nmad2 family putative nucleotide modification protein n=1 Tax=Paraburkholderia sp. 31.1 TaxID=2615205 RepID=UPI0016554C01|nr:hypothetical protein [Paraburkholderia sp. 31.1]MBC8725773.1 hypothetical protein [Paraburkholderia sp. 31.1]